MKYLACRPNGKSQIYTISGHGDLWCLDAKNGKKIWKYNILKKFYAPNLGWGTSASPVIYKNILVYNVGAGNGNSLVALNKVTGELIWATANDGAAYSTPLVAKICDEIQIVFFTKKGAVAIHPQNGKVLWRYKWKPSRIAVTPICYKNYVFISSSYGVGGALIKISKQGNKFHVAKIWKHTKMQNHYTTSILWKNYLYGFHNSIFVCIDFKTGKKQWSKRGFKKGLLIGIEGHAIVLGQRGSLALVKLSPKKYIERGRSYLFPKTNCLTVPTISNGRLFVRNNKEMVCLDITGKLHTK